MSSSRIEELPDDFDESLNLNKPSSEPMQQPAQSTPAGPSPPPASSEPFYPTDTGVGGITASDILSAAAFPFDPKNAQQSNSTTPSLPAGMASVRAHTADEILAMMNRTPLFMTDLESGAAPDEEGNENVMLEALRALQYEGTRAEVAGNFREQGNEMARQKYWKDGREFYDKGIAVIRSRGKKILREDGEEMKYDEGEGDEVEIGKERVIEEACLANRALCNLELKNYRSTTLDCAAALKLNPKNIKAYYRSSLALLALDKLSEAEDAAARGLTLDPSNKSLQTTLQKITARKTLLAEKEAKRKAEADRKRQEARMLAVAIQAREIAVKSTEKPPELEDAVMHLSPDPLSPESTLMFPCVLLYPTDAQSDFIKAFAETDSISDHLEYIFPLPWDERGEYKISTVECYMETVAGGLAKVGKKMSLLRLLSGWKVPVVDGLVKINVVPSSKAKAWIEEMKKRMGK